MWVVYLDNLVGQVAYFDNLAEVTGLFRQFSVKNSIYQPIRIEPRSLCVNLPKSIDLSLIGLFFLFVTPQLLDTVAEQINEKARQFYDDKETILKERPWKTITGTEIGGVLGVLLITGLYKLSNIESY